MQIWLRWCVSPTTSFHRSERRSSARTEADTRESPLKSVTVNEFVKVSLETRVPNETKRRFREADNLTPDTRNSIKGMIVEN